MKPFRALAIALAAVVGIAVHLSAQSNTPPPAIASTQMKIVVNIARLQGGKTISSLPYTLSPNSPYGRDNGATLRIGTRIPVQTSRKDGGVVVPTVEYQDVGTNIDCSVVPATDGKYRITVTINETSLYERTETTRGATARGVAQSTSGRPTLRSFQTTGAVFLRDGETAELSNTADKSTGETVKVDVSLAISK
ncbi:MAG TPA: hypothetical protein VJP86_12315 [Vicinamibacterales bacterium]|jgi:hypothetical protein|nr:hypothetical protein [Vicinamibacterales bacterium]